MWEKLPFLAVLVSVFGVYSGNAFGRTCWVPGRYWDEPSQSCKNCPDGYLSEPIVSPAMRIEDCFKIVNWKREYYGQVTCDPGKYMPKDKWECHKCPSDKYCPGGTYIHDSGQSQGAYTCPGSLVPDENNISCTGSVDPSGSALGGGNGGGNTGGAGNTGGMLPPGQNNGGGTPPTTCSSHEYKTSSGCEPCPTEFDFALLPATSQEYCFTRPDYDDDLRLFYKKVTCSKGQYLPKEHGYNSLESGASNGCKPCPMTDNKRYCPGVTAVFPSLTSDQGYVNCPGNQVPNSDGTQCVSSGGNPPTTCSPGQYKTSSGCKNCPNDFTNSELNATSPSQCWNDALTVQYKQVTCEPGQYLPKAKETCSSSCPTNKVCEGGTWYTHMTQNQGIKDCPTGQTPSSDHKTCQNPSGGGAGGGSGTFTCSNGNYLPAHATTGCVKCTDIHKYCPGGKTYTTQSYDQGIFDCPPNGVASSDWKTCNIKLSQIKMKFGPNGTATKLQNQCWLKTDIKDYAKCEFPNTGSLKTYSYKDDALNTQVAQQ